MVNNSSVNIIRKKKRKTTRKGEKSIKMILKKKRAVKNMKTFLKMKRKVWLSIEKNIIKRGKSLHNKKMDLM